MRTLFLLPNKAYKLCSSEERMVEKIGQEQIHELLFHERLSWQAIIYDLINSEQLDPWDIDLSVLSQKYLEKVRELEEADFFISSKVLLAASLLLRIKSEIVLSQDIPTLDDILFGKKEEKVYVQERMELDGEVPALVPRTPLPRFRRVTLEELMSALGKAISTETRRIRKQVIVLQQEKETEIAMPKNQIALQERIQNVYTKLNEWFVSRRGNVSFSEFLGSNDRLEQIGVFVSLLHLDNQQKVWLEQKSHFEEIFIWLKHMYESENREKLDAMKAEVEAFMIEASKGVEDSDEHLGGDGMGNLAIEEGEPIEDDADVRVARNADSGTINVVEDEEES